MQQRATHLQMVGLVGWVPHIAVLVLVHPWTTSMQIKDHQVVQGRKKKREGKYKGF
jgi:hypothetical protein